jgi:3-oxoacyl-[acyl-carrier-protein] synthase-3
MRLPKNKHSAEEKVDKFDFSVCSKDNVCMNGREVVPKTVKRVLEKNNIMKEDVDLFVFHQANEYMLKNLQEKLKIPNEKIYIYMKDSGNTNSRSITIVLNNALKEKRIKKNSNILLCGFGAGYSWGSMLIKQGE